MTALWIVLLTGAFAGWAVLDGANQGLGATLRRIGATPAERRTVLTALGPFLLSGEVWLIAGVGVLLAGFATFEAELWFVAYPLVIALLVAWVLRDAGVWLRSRSPSVGWRSFWERVVIGASLALPAAAGALLGAALSWLPGLPLASRELVPALAALTAVATTRVLGTMFVATRTTGVLRERALAGAERALPRAAALLAVCAVGYGLLVPADQVARAVVPPLLLVGAAGSLLVARRLLAVGRVSSARLAVVVAGALPVVAAAVGLGPALAASAGSASGLGVALAACVPVLLATQWWVWSTFRHPVGPRDAVFF